MRQIFDQRICLGISTALIIALGGTLLGISIAAHRAAFILMSLFLMASGISLLAQIRSARVGLAGGMKMLESARQEMKSWNIAQENKQERYEAILFSAGNNLPRVIKALRSIYDLNLQQANMLAEATVPWIIVRGASGIEAEYVRTKLAAAGAEVQIAKDIP
jgi:ribosomal protein L7/L12